MPIDIDRVRRAFPALHVTDNGQRRIYLDNPAGTQVPATVADAVHECLIQSSANLGGGFRTSAAADGVVRDARLAMADFLNARSPDEIVFGQNMTSLTFQLSRSIGRLLRPGDEIVLSTMDHDANIQPWVLLARDLGLEIRWIEFNTSSFEFDEDVLDDVLSQKTRLLCIAGASNLLGTVNDVAVMCARARDRGVMTYVDAVQSVPHVATDVQAIGCDFLVCSAYKFFGPHLGILYGRQERLNELEPYRVRPAPALPPGAFETGTQSHEAMAGTSAAVDYLATLGEGGVGAAMSRRAALRVAMARIADYERRISERLIEGLLGVEGISVLGLQTPSAYSRRVPTVAFVHASCPPQRIADALAAENIFLWSGHNYALEVARSLGVLDNGGVVRVGPVHYNTLDEIDDFIETLDRICRDESSN